MGRKIIFHQFSIESEEQNRDGGSADALQRCKSYLERTLITNRNFPTIAGECSSKSVGTSMNILIPPAFSLRLQKNEVHLKFGCIYFISCRTSESCLILKYLEPLELQQERTALRISYSTYPGNQWLNQVRYPSKLDGGSLSFKLYRLVDCVSSSGSDR